MPESSTTIVGNITKQPEVHFANSGIAMCSFSVAVNKSKKNRDTGEWEKEVHFFDVISFGQLAQNVANTFQQGNRVILTGELQVRKYQGQDGTEKNKVEILAEEVGASINWATASITRNEFQGEQGGNKYAGNQHTTAPRTAPQATTPTFDEEPF